MNYDFTADSEKITSLGSYINNNIAIAAKAIQNIYKTIEDMETNGIWSGKPYDAFLENCNSYKSSLENAIVLMTAYANVLNKIALGTTSLNTNIVNTSNLDEE